MSQHGCALHMSMEIHLQCFPLETTSLFRSADIWSSHARSYLVPRRRCALHMSMKIHVQCFPIETISLSRPADIWYLGTGVRYICQWKDISNDFLLKPFPCFGQLILMISYTIVSRTSERVCQCPLLMLIPPGTERCGPFRKG